MPGRFAYSQRRGEMSLFTAANPKLLKGLGVLGYLPWVMHLSPARGQGKRKHAEMCPGRSPGCTAACLNNSGRGGISEIIQNARYAKTMLWLQEPERFLAMVEDQIERAIEYTTRKGYVPCFRLNGTSDVDWENYPLSNGLSVFQRFPNVQFYDYTKLVGRATMRWPANYHLTFSASETNATECKRVLAMRRNVSVVFRRDTPLPKRFHGYRVIDGDQTDLRFLDPKGVVVGLQYKVNTRSGKKVEALARERGFIQNPAVGDSPDLENVESPQRAYAGSQVVFDVHGEPTGIA